MAPPNGEQTHKHIEKAEVACDELRTALGAVGVTLPSLRVDALAYGDELAVPLVELGRCNVPTALALAAALRKAQV